MSTQPMMRRLMLLSVGLNLFLFAPRAGATVAFVVTSGNSGTGTTLDSLSATTTVANELIYG